MESPKDEIERYRRLNKKVRASKKAAYRSFEVLKTTQERGKGTHRQAEVGSKRYGIGLSQFHNPGHAIANAISDSMDYNKVMREAPSECRHLDPETMQEIERESRPDRVIPIKEYVSETEHAKCYRHAHSGRMFWVPKSVIINDGPYGVRVPFWYHRRLHSRGIFRPR